MASINVKNQDEFNKLNWEDKFKFTKENPNHMFVNNEVLRTKNVLETNPTDSAHNYAAGLTALRSGESLENVLGDAFDKGKYGYRGASDNFKRENTMPNSPEERNARTDGIPYNAAAGNGKGEVVAARDYINSVAGSKGANYNIGFNNGMVLVNGRQIKPQYIENGVAYILKSDIDGLLSGIDADRGRETNRGILNENELKWAEDYNRALDNIRNREPFSYKAKDDPIYRDFEEFYLKRLDENANDLMAKASANTYGMTNMGAIVGAEAQRQRGLEELAQYQKQFRDDAYSRYLDEQALRQKELDIISGLRAEDLERNYNVHRQDIDDERYNHTQDWQDKFNWQQQAQNELGLERTGLENRLYGTQVHNEIAKETGGYAPGAENYGLDPMGDPYLRTKNEFDMGLGQADRQAEQELKWQKELIDYQNQADISKYQQTTGVNKGSGSSSGSGITKNYTSKRDKLIGYINDDAKENEGVPKLITRNASGNWVYNGGTAYSYNYIINAIAQNNDLNDAEKDLLLEELGIYDKIAAGENAKNIVAENYYKTGSTQPRLSDLLPEQFK